MKNKRETNNIFNSWKLIVGVTREKQFISFISMKILELLELKPMPRVSKK